MTAKRHLPTPRQELLLVAALEDGETAAAAAREWASDVEVSQLDGSSLQLLPLLHHNLSRLGIAPEVRNLTASAYRSSWVRAQLLLRHLPAALGALAAAGIPTLVHKGAALGHAFYRDIGARPMADLDVLVPTRQARPAIEALLRAGWSSPSPFADLDHHQHSTPLSGPEGVELDLHWHLLADAEGTCTDEDFWKAAVPFDAPGLESRTLCPSDHLLQAIVHASARLDSATIRWIADAITILRSSRIDWDRVLTQAARRRFVLALREAVEYISGHFSVELPTELPGRLRDLGVTLFERVEFAEKRQGPNLLTPYWRYQRRHSNRSLIENLLAFPSHLARRWNTNRPIDFFRHVLERLRARRERR